MRTSNIYDNVSSNPTVTSDINIGVKMSLYQTTGAPGYAYEQSVFGSNYFLTNNNPSLGSSTPNLPIYISGSVGSGAGNYAQFDGEVDYTWIPGTYTLNSGTTTYIFTPTGLPSPLGQLDYSFYLPSGGSFPNTTLYSSGTLANILPVGDGELALDGYFWVAGDPVNISISSSVPEPSTLVLLGVGAFSVAGYAWRRRRRMKA